MEFSRQFAGRLLSEFTGTAMLLCLMCMECIPGYERDKMEIAFAIGLVVMAAIHCFGFISQAHINPSVTILLTILNVIDWKIGIIYIVLQFAGAFIGFGMSMLVRPKFFSEVDDLNYCLTQPAELVEWHEAFMIEFMLTSILAFFCAAVFDPRTNHKDSISFRFGMIISGLITVGGIYTGCSVNMVRTLAPHILQMNFDNLWIYPLAQILAAILVGILWRFVMSEKKDQETTTDP